MNDRPADREAWRAQLIEAPIEPDLPIIDPHHHIWPQAPVPQMEAWGPEDLFAYKAGSGHKLVKTVFVEAHVGYRTEGPTALAPVGETEYADRTGRQADARGGPMAGAVAGIVATADMMLGDAVEEVLLAHLAASSRMRGIRYAIADDPDMPYDMGTRPGMMAEPTFRAGFGKLAPLGLSFDVWAMQSQLDEVAALADAFPTTTIIVDHLGVPLGIGRFATDPQAAFEAWRSALARVAARPNVMLKLGGLNMELTGLCAAASDPAPWSSERLAEVQGRHLLTGIELFGPSRCMFESNFPVDRMLSGATVLWNGFKRVVADFSAADKAALFHDTAARVYRL